MIYDVDNACQWILLLYFHLENVYQKSENLICYCIAILLLYSYILYRLAKHELWASVAYAPDIRPLLVFLYKDAYGQTG